jgi:hypothetical protein
MPNGDDKPRKKSSLSYISHQIIVIKQPNYKKSTVLFAVGLIKWLGINFVYRLSVLLILFDELFHHY